MIYSTYKDYLKEVANNVNSKHYNSRHIDICLYKMFNASRNGKYSITYKLPWYYIFDSSKKHSIYMALHNYFKYKINLNVSLIIYKGDIQYIDLSWI